ncbi:MAG TPA: hypothetical protein VE987_06625 [Polyangiaceae bacterium]|nr:hypothetical protein [Polyangiaceae bacterium]
MTFMLFWSFSGVCFLSSSKHLLEQPPGDVARGRGERDAARPKRQGAADDETDTERDGERGPGAVMDATREPPRELVDARRRPVRLDRFAGAGARAGRVRARSARRTRRLRIAKLARAGGLARGHRFNRLVGVHRSGGHCDVHAIRTHA